MMGEATAGAPNVAARGAQRVEEAIRARLGAGRRALIPFLTAGDPGPEESVQRMLAAIDGGADILEVGLPFSDPVADGPTLQAAAERALRAGGGTEATLGIVARVCAERPGVPVVILTYLNPVLRPGAETFAARAAAAGAAALIVPDLSLEESAPVRAALHRRDVGLIAFAAPTSGTERLERMAAVAEGFVYCVARLGVTGANAEVAASAAGVVARVRAATDVPCAVGFGIGTPQAAAAASRVADGVIVGSALAALRSGDGPPSARAVGELVSAMRRAMDELPATVEEGS